jgi:hypothetical protein
VSTATSPVARQPRLITPRRVVISILVAAALGMFGWAFASGRDTPAVRVTDPAVESAQPAQGDLALRQSRIGVDLATGYTATLSIDGTPIPDDQIERVVGLDQYYYTPGPGTVTGQLAPGRHCAAADITKLGLNGAQPQTHTYRWCFSLH